MMPAVRVLFSEILTDIPRNQSMDFNGAAKRYGLGMNVWNMARGCNVAFIDLATSTMEQSVIGDTVNHRVLQSEI